MHTVCAHKTHQEEVAEALEALSTLTDVTVTCDYGVLCNATAASTCSVEFLTELGDVPLVSASVSNVDSLSITEYQVNGGWEEGGEWIPTLSTLFWQLLIDQTMCYTFYAYSTLRIL